jgi:hypothetical protein
MINLSGELLAPSQVVRWYTFVLLVAVTVGIALWRRRGPLGAAG